MEHSPQTPPRVKRPFWFVLLVTFIGALLVAGIIAFVDAQGYYFILIFPMLMGLAGGIFAWVILEERGQQGTWSVAFAGAIGGLLIFLAYRYLSYRLAIGNAEIELSFVEYTRLLAEMGVSITRLSFSIDLSPALTWGLWGIEVAITMFCGAWISKHIKL